MTKYLYLFSILTLIATFILLTLIGYWLFYPDNIVVVENPNQIKVDKQVYKHEEHIKYTFSYCKSRPMFGLIARALTNDITITYTNIYSDLEAGCHSVTFGDLFIPEFAPPGKYHINISAEYKINPIRTFIVNLQTVEFMVIE